MKESGLRTERLRILATSDLHMHLVSFDYYRSEPTQTGSLSALVDVISELRRGAAAQTPSRNCLLLDNGDLLQGTPLGDHIAGMHKPGATNPVAMALNAVGYDAIGLGNHDFDYGLQYVDDFARDMSAPVLSSNLTADPPLQNVQGSTLLAAGNLRVGIVSVLPPATLKWTTPAVAGAIDIAPMATAVRSHTQALKAQGADIVVALAHTGFGQDPQENDLAMIAKTGGVDAIIAGHTHREIPGPGHCHHDGFDPEKGSIYGTPVVMPGFAGSCLGCIDLDLEYSDDGTWQVRHFTAWLERARPRVTPLAPPLLSLGPSHDAAVADLDRYVSQNNTDLTSYFAQAAPGPMLSLLAKAQWNAIDATRRGTEYEDMPLLSAVSAARAGGLGGIHDYVDIPAGKMRARHLSQMLPFANSLVAVDITGATLTEWLEKSASCFRHISADRPDQGLIDPAFPFFDADVIFGTQCEFNLDVPAGYNAQGRIIRPDVQRVLGLSVAGQPVRGNDRFLVAVNSYRAGGGGNFPGLGRNAIVLEHPASTLQVLRDFLTDPSPSVTPFPTPWRFAQSTSGRQSWIETGPDATPHLHEIAHLWPGPPELQSSGFVHIPITL